MTAQPISLTNSPSKSSTSSRARGADDTLPLPSTHWGYRIATDSSGDLWSAYYLDTGDPATRGMYASQWNPDSSTWTSTLAFPTNINPSEYRRAQYAIDQSDNHHIAIMDSGVKHFTNAGGSWSMTHHATGTVDSRSSMSMAISDANDVHIAWYDFADKDLMHSRGIGGTWYTSAVHDFDADDGYPRSIDITLDDQGDPRIYALVDDATGDAAMIYYGSFADPSLDASSVPSDSNSDGTCDALSAAILTMALTSRSRWASSPPSHPSTRASSHVDIDHAPYPQVSTSTRSPVRSKARRSTPTPKAAPTP